MTIQLRENPQRYAYNVLEKQLETLVKEKKLDYTGCIFIAREYIFSFVNRFASLLGLDQKKSYTTSEIRDGYYRHLQFWLSEEMKDISQENAKGEVRIHLDGYVERDPTPREETAHEIAQRKAENIDADPPRHQIYGDDFDQGTLEKMIEVLVNSPVDRIEEPYIIRDRMDYDSSEATHILDFYSDDAIFKNIATYYTHYAQEYRRIIGQNFPSLQSELSKYRTTFLVVVIDVANIRRGRGEKRGWSIQRFWLESDEEDLRTEIHRSEDEEVANNPNPWENDVYDYAGQEYDIVGGGSSGDMLLVDLDHEQCPVFEQVHEELNSKLDDYLREKKVGLHQPKREE